MIGDYVGWGDLLGRLISEISDMKLWALFDASDAGTYCSGRISSRWRRCYRDYSNQGAGAGVAFEDMFVLSALLARMLAVEGISKVSSAFGAVRRPRV